MVSKPLLSKRNTIRKGYAAFNDADWDTVSELLCANVVWHPMHGGEDIVAGMKSSPSSNAFESPTKRSSSARPSTRTLPSPSTSPFAR